MWSCFQRSDTLFNTTDSLKCLAAVLLDVHMQHLKLCSDMLDCGCKTDHRIPGFVVAFGEAHRTHRSHADGRSSYSSDDLDHGLSLAALSA